jgi:hypothetical protein
MPCRTRKTISQVSASEPFGRRAAQGRSDREQRDADQHHPAVAEDVRDPAAEREERRQREQIAVDHPLDGRRRDAELVLDVRHGDGHDGLVDEHHRDGEHHGGERDILLRAGRRGRGRHHSDANDRAGTAGAEWIKCRSRSSRSPGATPSAATAARIRSGTAPIRNAERRRCQPGR